MFPLEKTRIEKRLTQEKLSELSSVSVRQIRKYEKSISELGKSRISTSTRLAEALGVDVEVIAPIKSFKQLE